MEAQSDFEELLRLFNAQAVEYVIIGAHALAYHGAPRYTGDMDIYIRPRLENAQRIIDALTDFGFGGSGLSVKDFTEPDRVVQLGYPPVRIDLITSISGVSWQEAYSGRVEAKYGDIKASYLGRRQLVENKRACGRKKDLADLEALGEA